MKSTQLLSVVLSMILVLGASAGPAFAQVDDDMDDTSIEEYDDEREEYDDDLKEDYDDDRYDKHADLDDRLEHFCEMTDEEKRQFFADHPRIEQFADRLANYCEMF